MEGKREEKGKAAPPPAHCPDCRGSGVVTYGCGAIPCAACGGSGIAPGIGGDREEDHGSSPDGRKAT